MTRSRQLAASNTGARSATVIAYAGPLYERLFAEAST